MNEICFVESSSRIHGKAVRYFEERDYGKGMSLEETIKDIWDGQFGNDVSRVLVLEDGESGTGGRWRDATHDVVLEIVSRCYANDEIRQADFIEQQLGCSALIEVRSRLRIPA
jgi:hypothetical protein